MIRYFDLTRQYKEIQKQLQSAVISVLDGGAYVLGKEVANFESRFAEYCQVNHSVGVSSGTAALHIALLAAGIVPNDEVITVPFTFIATVSSIIYAGAKPVFVDVHPDTLVMDVDKVRCKITPKTKAIVPVHLYGQMVDMGPLMQLAKEFNLKIIEDASQAHGATQGNRSAGSIGDFGCFSFYPGKNLGACGEGGAIVTNRPELFELAKVYRDWGQEKRYYHKYLGFNYRMDAIQGAVLGVKLKFLDQWTQSRQRIAENYKRHLEANRIQTPSTMKNNKHVYHIYAIRSVARAKLQQELYEHGVETNIHYPIPVHLQECMRHLGYEKGDFPIAEKAANEVLSLPMYPELTEIEQAAVITAVNKLCAKLNA